MISHRLSGSQNQCIWCGQHFAGPNAYGMHFDADTALCLTPVAMRAIGMVVTAAGFWAVPPAAPRAAL